MVTINFVDPADGKFQFNPGRPGVDRAAGGPIGACVIDFTVDVLKAPPKDADATQPGIQTLNFSFAGGGTADGQVEEMGATKSECPPVHPVFESCPATGPL